MLLKPQAKIMLKHQKQLIQMEKEHLKNLLVQHQMIALLRKRLLVTHNKTMQILELKIILPTNQGLQIIMKLAVLVQTNNRQLLRPLLIQGIQRLIHLQTQIKNLLQVPLLQNKEHHLALPPPAQPLLKVF